MIFKENRVTTERGDILAQKIRGKWETRNPETLAFIAEHENKSKPAPKPKSKKVEVEEKLEMVRARDEDGQFVADDPETPEVNEAWVVKTVKKAIKKK
jgi:hypothetical protein